MNMLGYDDTSSVANSLLGYSSTNNGKVSRDEYGYTEKDREAEKARIYKSLGQSAPAQPVNSPYGGLSIPDAYSNASGQSSGEQIEISDEYASRHRAERLGKTNLLDKKRKGKVGDTQYTNENPGVNRNDKTTWLGKAADSVDDSFDDAWKYIFGNKKYKNKKEEEEAARNDMNMQVNEDGNVIYSRQATMNDTPLETLRNQVMNLEDDPEGDQLLYYGRIDNPDGTSSYKIGLAGADTFGRTSEEDRGKDITYLWAKRTKDAAKYEALFHGNRDLLKSRRNDIGTDVEGYGAGKTEIYNEDFLGLDGTITMDKIKTLNMSTASKLRELGVYTTGRYDSRGMESGYKELEKAERIYGKESKQYKEMSYLMANMEHTGKQTRALVDVPGDLISAVASSTQQVVAGVGDMALDAVTPGNNVLLDNAKSAEVADKAWGYRGRKEVEALGRQAVHKWKDGDYVGALVKGIQASPDTVAQSLPDMALMMFTGGSYSVLGATAATIGQAAMKKTATEMAKASLKASGTKATKEAIRDKAEDFVENAVVKAAGEKAAKAFNDRGMFNRVYSPTINKGLMAFAGKQTNNQIDDRLSNGDEDVGYGEIAGMFASNYALAGIDRWALGKELDIKPIKAMISKISDEGAIGVAKKAATIVTGLVKSGSIEAGQEFMQTWGEVINSKLGTPGSSSDIFSDEYLDEATKGALLGFGAGGLMNTGALAGKGILVGVKGAKEKIKKVKDANEFTESNMPFNDTGTLLDKIHPNMSKKEMSELIGDDVETTFNTVNSYLQSLPQEEQDAILGNELQSTTLDLFVNTAKEKNAANTETTTSTTNTFKKHDVTGILDRAISAETMEDSTSGADLEQELRKPNAVGPLLKAVENIHSDAEIDQSYKDRLAEVFIDIATKPREASDSIIAKQAEAALNKLGIEFVLEKGNNETSEEVYNSMFTSKDTKEDVSELTREQKFRKIVEKIVSKKTKGTTDVNSRVEEVIGFFTSLNPNTQKEKQYEDLLDLMTDEGYGSAIAEVNSAMETLSDTNKASLLELETKINYLLLEIGATTRSRTPEQKKDLFNTRYDMLIGNNTSDSGFSIQNYIDNAMKLMQENIPLPVRNAGLRNFKTRLKAWAVRQQEKIDNDLRKESLKKIARDELAMISNVEDLIDGFINNDKATNTKPKTENLEIKEDEDTISYTPKHSFQTMEIPVDAVIVEDGNNYMDGATRVEVRSVTKSKKIDKYYADVYVTIGEDILKFNVQITEKAANDFIKHEFKTEEQLKKEKAERKKKKEEKKKKENASKSTEELLKEGIKKQLKDTSFYANIDAAKGSEELLAVVNAMIEAKAFLGGVSTYALVKTLETGVDFTSFAYENMETIEVKTTTEPISKEPIITNGDLSKLDLDEIFITPDTEHNLATAEKSDLALTKLNSIVKAVVNVFNTSEISKAELQANKSLVLLLGEDNKLSSDYLNLAIKSVVDNIVRNSRSLSVDYNDQKKDERLNIDVGEVDSNVLAAAGIPKNTLIDIIAKDIIRGMDWKKSEKTITLELEDVSTDSNPTITVDENAHNIDVAVHILAAKILAQITADNVLQEHKVDKGSFIRLPITYMFESTIPVTDITETSALDTLGEELDSINEKLGFEEDKEKIGIITDPKNFGSMSKLVKRGKQTIGKKAKSTIENIRNMAFRIANKNSAILKASPEQLFQMYGVELSTIPPAILKHFSIDTSSIPLYEGIKPADEYAAYNSYMVKRYMTSENAGSVIGKVMQTVQVVKTVQELKRHLLTKSGRMKTDAKVYYDAFIGSNARIYLKTEGFSTIQEDKLLRHLFILDNPTFKPKTIKDGSFDHLVLMQDMMIGLGGIKGLVSPTYKGEDKSTPEATHKEFQKIVTIFNKNKKLRGLVGKYKDSTLSEEELDILSDLVGGIKDYTAMNALVALHTYINTADNASIDITAESDGKNSAVAFALMSNSSNAPYLRVMLLSVGVITKDGLAEYAKELSEDKKEALRLLTSNGHLPSQEELNAIHPIQDAYQAAATKFIHSIPEEGRALIAELIGEELIDSNGNVTKAGRAFAKDPTMTFHYGRQAKAMAGGVGNTTTATFLEDVLSSDEFTIEEKLAKLKSVIESSNTLIEKKKKDIRENGSKTNRTAEAIKKEISKIESLLIKDVEVVLNRVKQKLVNNAADTVVNDVIVTLKDSVTSLLGIYMYESLADTYKGLNDHEAVVLKGYNLSYAIKKAYRTYLETTNAEVAVYAEVQEFMESELGITNSSFAIGESVDDQQLNIMKNQPSQNMYDETGAGAGVEEGGNRLTYTRPDGKKETIRLPRRETKNASTSLSPLGTHRRDTNVVHRVLEFLKVNQIFDAFVTSGRSRILSEWLANLEFVRQTLFTPHEVTYTIRNLKELQKSLNVMKLASNDNLAGIVETILEDRHVLRSIFGDKAKAKGKTMKELSTALVSTIKSLEVEEKRLDNQRTELFNNLTTIGQYGVMGTVEFSNGKLLGFRLRLGTKNKLISIGDLGLSNDIDLSSEEDMINISKSLVAYVTKNNDIIAHDVTKDTDVTVIDIVAEAKKRIEETSRKRREVGKQNRELKKNTLIEDYIDAEDIFAEGNIDYFDADIPHDATIVGNEQTTENESTAGKKPRTEEEKAAKIAELKEEQEEFNILMNSVVGNNDNVSYSIASEMIGEEIESIQNVDENTIERIFNEYMSDPDLTTVDSILAREVFDKYVLPLIKVIHKKDFTQLNLVRKTVGEEDFTSGKFVEDMGTEEYTVIIGEGKSEQSKAEVLNHEILHALFISILGKNAPKNAFSKEISNVRKLHRKVKGKADKSWFGEGESAIHQYSNVFKNKKEDRNLVEFAIYMITNATFRNNVNKHIGEIKTTDNIGLKIDGSKSIVYKAYNFIEDLFFKVLDLFKGADSNKKAMPSKVVDALVSQLLAAEKKEVSKSFRNRLLDLFAYMDAYVGRVTKPEKYVLPLVTKNSKNIIIKKFEDAKKLVGKNLKLEELSDVSELGAFLHSTMKTPESVIKYVEHFVKATSVLSTNKTGYIRKVVKSILSPKGSKDLDVKLVEDEKLNDLLVEYDIGALWKVPRITFSRLIDVIKNKHNNRTIIKDILVKKLMVVLQTSTNEDIGILEIEDTVNFIVNAFENNKKGTNKKTNGIINATKGIDDLLYRAGLQEVVLTKEHKKTYTLVLDYLDALATIEVLERSNQTKLDTLVNTAVAHEDSSINILNHMYSILNHTDSDLVTYRSLKPKGKYRDLEDETESIMAIHRNKSGRLTATLPPVNELVHKVKLPNGEGTIEYYKVKTSPLNTMHQGSIGYIDNSIFSDPSMTPKDVSKLVDEILKDDYLSQYLLPVTGKSKTEVKMVIPSFLSRKHMDIDNRVSARLGHIIGRIEEEKDATKLNLDLLDIMEKDFSKNYSKHPEDFVFVSKGSRNSDLRKYYNLLPAKFHTALDKNKYSLAQTGGIWVRKDTLRYNFGSVGIGLSEVLSSYGITNKTVHKVTVLAEKGLADLARFMKLEIAGKLFEVILGNFVSNVLLETLKLRNPIEVIRLTIEGMKYHYLLNNDINKLIEVKASLDTFENKTKLNDKSHKQYGSLIKSRRKLEKAIENSPVNYLHKAGFNSALKEDITSEEALFMSKNIKALRKKTPKALYELGEQLYMGGKTDIGKVFSNLVSASDFGSRYATDQLDAKYFKSEVRRDFKALMKVNAVKGSTRLFKEYYGTRLKIFEKERNVKLAKQHIIYGESGGKFLTAMDTLGPGAFYKFKQRINQVLIERYSDKPASALIVGVFLAYIDSLGTMNNLIERPEESFSDFFSNMESYPVDNLGVVVSPPLLALLGITK